MSTAAGDVTSQISHVETTLTKAFQKELAQLREAQRQAEIARQQADGDKKRERDEIANAQKDTVARLMEMQVEEARTRAERQKIWNGILATLGTILAALSAGTLYVAAGRQDDPKRVAEETAAPVAEHVEQSQAAIESRMDKAERKIVQLRDAIDEQQVQIADSVDFLADKLDAISPKSKLVDMPESVTLAKHRAEKVKESRRKAQQDLFADDGE
jgi:hypothetical protein